MLIFYIVLVFVIVGVIFFSVQTYSNLTVLAIASITALIIPFIVWGATMSIAKSSDENYYEFWNGSEVATLSQVMECRYNGSCVHDYDCDPYTVVETETYTDSKGDLQTRLVTKTKWNSCPYSKQETSYYVDTTLGRFTAAHALMTGEPYRNSVSIPNGRVTSPPIIWTEAKTRIDAGKPGGVTKQSMYKNYILSSDVNLFKKFNDSIEQYKKENLLIDPARKIEGLYSATKVYDLSSKLDTKQISAQLPYLNAKFGSVLKGDLHIVFVDDSRIKNPHDYAESLHAYWVSEEQEKHAIAKNAYVMIVGVGVQPELIIPETEDASESNEVVSGTPSEASESVPATQQESVVPPGTIIATWVKAFTGMPLGNEALITQTESDLKGVPLDENFIGMPIFNPKNGTYADTNSAVENILFGANKFIRVSMEGENKDDTGTGFKYLSESWKPSFGALLTFHIISGVVSLGVLVLGFYLSRTQYQRSPDVLSNFIKTIASHNK